MRNFDLMEKSLWLPYPPHFVYDFSRKIFLKLYSINQQSLNVRLSLRPEILGNMFIVIISFAVDTIIILKINHTFLSKPFSGMVQKRKEQVR